MDRGSGKLATQGDLEAVLFGVGDPAAEWILSGRTLDSLSRAVGRHAGPHAPQALRGAVLAVLMAWEADAECEYGRERMRAAIARLDADPFGADGFDDPRIPEDPLGDLLAGLPAFRP